MRADYKIVHVSLNSIVNMDYFCNEAIDFLIIKFSRNTSCVFTADTQSFYHYMNSGNSISETSVTDLSQIRKLRYFRISVVSI